MNQMLWIFSALAAAALLLTVRFALPQRTVSFIPKRAVFFTPSSLPGNENQGGDLIRIHKAAHRLELLHGDAVTMQMAIALGFAPTGPKRQEGDGRTPEGRYRIDAYNASSGYHRALHISYPNAQDRARAKALGVPPGGAVMIHGQKNGFGWFSAITQRFDWTRGCVALSDEDMDVLIAETEVGIPVEILP